MCPAGECRQNTCRTDVCCKFAGRKDIRQLESVLRGVTSGRNRMHGIWSTLAALQAAGITQDDPSWTLLRGLDISTAADVLASLQVGQPADQACSLGAMC